MPRSLLLTSLLSVSVACATHSHAVPLPGVIEPRAGSPAWHTFVNHLRDSLAAADPAHEAEAAIARGDYHLLGVSGYELFVPNLASDWTKYKPGIYVLPAGGDFIQSPDQEAYMHVADQYAAAYNRAILAAVPRNP